MKPIRIGTRKSKLAMWQAEFIESLLNKNNIETQLVPIETKGDKVLDVSIAKIGSKGVFTEELEYLLETGQIDMAIHSAKDLPSELPEKFKILAFTKREKENDVLISDRQDLHLQENGPAFKIGTSSTRRISTIKHYYPQIETVEMRGNLQTRIQKMRDGLCDALLLAYAGVSRMGYHDIIRQELDLSIFTPAVGQGSLAVEISSDMGQSIQKSLKIILNNVDSEIILKAERAYLKRLKGGCSIPAFAHAMIDNDTLLLNGGIFSLDGKELVKETVRGELNDPERLGLQLGNSILEKGGSEILKRIREELNK